MPMPQLIITSATPSWVKRCRHVVYDEFCLHLELMPDTEWVGILSAALDHEKLPTFREAVKAATLTAVQRRYKGVMTR